MAHFLPNDGSMDFTELLEYDEFDDDSANRSAVVVFDANIHSPVGVPLSVELLTAARNGAKVSTTEEDEQTSSFVKGSELFLRLDAPAAGAASSDTLCSDDTPIAGPSTAVFDPTTPFIGVELQYDNEFDGNDDDANDAGRNGACNRYLQFNDTSKSYHSMIENENEQLFMEGINLCRKRPTMKMHFSVSISRP